MTTASKALAHASAISQGWLAIALALSVQAYVLYYAFHYGTLSGLLQWDDCIIVQRGLENLDRLAAGTSGLTLLRAAWHFDIHSPLADIQTIVGLLLAGGHTWGPYLLDAVWLAVVLAALLQTFDRRSAVLAATAIVFVLFQPLTLNGLADLKADWSGGLLLAGALFILTRAAQTARQDLKLWGAVLLGLAILSKLTAFYLPVVAASVLLLFEWYSAVLADEREVSEGGQDVRISMIARLRALWRSIDRRALFVRLLIAVGPFVLFFLHGARQILSYIRSASGSGWEDGLSVLGRARFYGPYGPDSSMEWGTLHICFFVFVVAALLVAWQRREAFYPIALLVHLCIAALLAAPLVVANSNHSFAATLLGVIVSATLISMDYLARSFPGRGPWIVAVVVLACALPAPLPFKSSNYYSQFPVREPKLRQLADTYGRIVDAMVAQSHREVPHVVVFYDHVFAPHPNLAIEYFHRTGRLPAVDRVDDLAGPNVSNQLSSADFVLTIVPAANSASRLIADLYPTYPISQDPGRAESVLAATGRFESVGMFGVPGAEIHLYRPRDP
ncbi:MAG TPA: glycosyltransferase family 39 protein [Steroidobacteraceae bacterium]|jgi:hypothetical protein